MEKLLANEIRDELKRYLNKPHYLSEFTFNHNGTIADLLEVSDQIIGYEIKSDSDSYTRLSKQIQGYNSVCKKIYMVVGDSKSSTVFKHIPEFYGVIVAKRDSDGHVQFEELRSASNNPHWTHEAMLLWIPSVDLKRFAKTLPGLLNEYNGKKTPIGKLTKWILIEKVLKYATPAQIEKLVIEYLKSDDLQERRAESIRINQAIKNSSKRHKETELTRRINNWDYLVEDLDSLSKLEPRRLMARLFALGQSYLPLSLEYNARGIHNGKFVYNPLTETIDFILKGEYGFIDGFIVPDIINNTKFLNLLRRGLEEDFSLSILTVEIKSCVSA